jgi:hypothetical protein
MGCPIDAPQSAARYSYYTNVFYMNTRYSVKSRFMAQMGLFGESGRIAW